MEDNQNVKMVVIIWNLLSMNEHELSLVVFFVSASNNIACVNAPIQ